MLMNFTKAIFALQDHFINDVANLLKMIDFIFNKNANIFLGISKYTIDIFRLFFFACYDFNQKEFKLRVNLFFNLLEFLCKILKTLLILSLSKGHIIILFVCTITLRKIFNGHWSMIRALTSLLVLWFAALIWFFNWV